MHDCRTVKPDAAMLDTVIRGWSANAGVVLVFGATGVSPSAMADAVVRRVCDREAPGLEAALLRAALVEKSPAVSALGALSGAAAGVSGTAVLVSLPDELRVAEPMLRTLAGVLPQALALLLPS